MLRILTSVFLIASFFNGFSQRSEQIRSQIDSLIKAEKKVDFTGSVLVAKGNSILLHESYGIDKGSSFWIGSLSKQFCAAAILKLEELGKLSTMDKISEHLKDVPPQLASVTIHKLLTHSSGLENRFAADEKSSREDALAAIYQNKMVDPNTYGYSNDGYQLLAILIEEVSGQSYESFLQDNFFQPLQMTESGFSGDQKKWNELAMAPTKKENPQEWPVNYGYKGSTGILTSTSDLLKWVDALNSGILSNSDKLFQRHVIKSNKLWYGYGWNIYDSGQGEVRVHSGSDHFIKHNSTLRYYPDSQTLIIVLSSDGNYKGTGKARVLASKIIDLIF